MSVFEFIDYKEFVNQWLSLKPKNGHGQFRKIAQYLSVHPTLLSQVFRGPKNLSMEQADALGRYMSLSEIEQEYFLLLVQYSQAGTESLRQHINKLILKCRERGTLIKNRVKRTGELSESDKAIFYSNWYYSAVLMNLTIPGPQSIRSIAKRLALKVQTVDGVLDFLSSRGLIEKDGNRYEVKLLSSHVDFDSPFLHRHLTNWRMKSIQQFEKLTASEDIAYSAPLTISQKDATRVKRELVNFISELSKIVIPSDPEELRCINIDWFRV